MYALRRGDQWVSAPDGQGEGLLLPPVLALCSTADKAWLSPTLDQVLERQTLIRHCWGWATQVRALR